MTSTKPKPSPRRWARRKLRTCALGTAVGLAVMLWATDALVWHQAPGWTGIRCTGPYSPMMDAGTTTEFYDRGGHYLRASPPEGWVSSGGRRLADGEVERGQQWVAEYHVPPGDYYVFSVDNSMFGVRSARGTVHVIAGFHLLVDGDGCE